MSFPAEQITDKVCGMCKKLLADSKLAWYYKKEKA